MSRACHMRVQRTPRDSSGLAYNTKENNTKDLIKKFKEEMRYYCTKSYFILYTLNRSKPIIELEREGDNITYISKESSSIDYGNIDEKYLIIPKTYVYEDYILIEVGFTKKFNFLAGVLNPFHYYINIYFNKKIENWYRVEILCDQIGTLIKVEYSESSSTNFSQIENCRLLKKIYKEIKKLRTAIEYQPGNKGYEETLNHFKNLL